METNKLIFDEESGFIYNYFQVIDTTKNETIASGRSLLGDDELLALYETNPELAEKDVRLESLLNKPITPEPYQPTNAEVAQMISDLQADLIIAGVL